MLEDGGHLSDWPTDLAETLDLAIARFDANWHMITANTRWRQRYGISKGPLDVVAARMVSDSETGISPNGAAEHLSETIRLFARDQEVILPDGSTVLLTASPLGSGGSIVTTRDMQRDRLSEDASLRLLSNGFASADMGMLLWDAGLVVRLSNDAWARMFGPVTVGAPVAAIVDGLRDLGLGRSADAKTAPQSVDQVIAAMHRQPRQWVMKLPDDRSIRLFTHPTQSGGVLTTAIDITESRTVEQRAMEVLADVIEAVGVGIVMLDEGLKLRLCNGTAQGLLFGSQGQPTVGMTALQLVEMGLATGNLKLPAAMDFATTAQRLINEVLLSGETAQLVLKDGRHVEAVSYRTRLGGYVGVLHDITDRVAAEAAAEEANSRTHTIVETLGEGVALYDADLRLLMMNPAYRRVVSNDKPVTDVGDTFEDGVRANIRAGNLPVKPEDEDAAVESILEAVRTYQSDVEIHIVGGRILEASTFATPDGGYLLQMRDVTERRKAERAAREADILLRTTIEASPTPILISRRTDGRIFFLSEAFRALLGDIKSTVTIFDDEKALADFLDQLKRFGRVDDLPARLRKAGGGTVETLISARLITFDGDEVIISSLRDVSDIVEMQEELEIQRRHALQNEKLSALGELLAGVAHELSNPLSVVVGYSMMLKDSPLDEGLAQKVDRIAVAADRCVRIVKMFLALARERPAALDPCSIPELLQLALSVSSAGLEASGAEVILSVPDNLPAVQVDPDHITQVFANLIINAGHAVHHLGRAGRIDIRAFCARSGNTLVVEVADNGPGVPEDVQHRIFDPFFTTKKLGEGTGFGLAFSHRVVTAHEGTLTLVPQAERGAVFRITLPLVRCDDPEASDADAQVPAPNGSLRVLVLDDEEPVANMLGDLLIAEGYQVEVHTDGARALASCAASAPDLVICDMRMPVMDGQKFYDELSQISPSLTSRLIFVTGDTMNARVAAFMGRSGCRFLEKPIIPDELWEAIDNLIIEKPEHR